MKMIDEPLIIGEGQNKYVIEKTFITDEGYYGVCKFNSGGYRCGYVGIPVEHIMYGLDYNEPIVYNLDVHGSITYSGRMEDIESTRWFFGFDCAHLKDLKDISAARKYNMEIYYHAELREYVWLLEVVIEEVKDLSRQLLPEEIMKRRMLED